MDRIVSVNVRQVKSPIYYFLNVQCVYIHHITYSAIHPEDIVFTLILILTRQSFPPACKVSLIQVLCWTSLDLNCHNFFLHVLPFWTLDFPFCLPLLDSFATMIDYLVWPLIIKHTLFSAPELSSVSCFWVLACNFVKPDIDWLKSIWAN